MSTLINLDITPDIGIEDTDRMSVVELLQTALANEHLLYMKTRKYHWNVVGPHFTMLHAVFEEQYTAIADLIDRIAERVVMLGVPAIGTLIEMQQYTDLHEQPGQIPNARAMIENLLDDHEEVIRKLRDDARKCEKLNDMGTNDLLIEVMQYHEKTAWMLRALLQET